MLIRSGAVDVVAIDSVAALTPRAELEGQMGDQTVGLQARLMSQALRKLAGNLNRANTVCLFTNQIREKIGVMFGSPETQPGGRALKFYASQRIDIRRIETLKEGTEAVGNRVRAKIVKNKVAPPFRQAEFDIEYGVGISSEGCLIDLGIEHGIVQKSGAFFSYDGERLGQGRNNAKAFLRENPAMAQEIEAQDLRGARDRARRRAGAEGGAQPRRPRTSRGRQTARAGRAAARRPPEAASQPSPPKRPPRSRLPRAARLPILIGVMDRRPRRSTGVNETLAMPLPASRAAGRRRLRGASTARAATTSTRTSRRCCATGAPPRT